MTMPARPAKLYLSLMDGAPPNAQFFNAIRGCELVPGLVEADFAMVPYGVRRISPRFAAHVDETAARAAQYGKKTVVIISGDLGYRVHLGGVFAFKVSAYRRGKQQNEIIAPPCAADFWADRPFEPRRKSARPSVAFCGYAGFPSAAVRAKYFVRNAAFDAATLAALHWGAHKRGIYFRRKALRLLARDSRIETRFIVRDAFFLNAAPKPRDRATARREFLDNMRGADFALAPKGDGNYSIRFFEALSMGRIPVLIDTDMVLPLEKVIDYSKFIVRVPHTEVRTIPERIVRLYDSLSEEAFMDMQRAAREAFARYLRQDSFYAVALPLLRDRGPEAF